MREAEARRHLHRSETVFLAAAAAFVFGVLSAWQTLSILSRTGETRLGPTPLSYWVIWAICLFGFGLALGVTAIMSRNSGAPNH